jgi:two-component system chemotaxis response regulator CheV
MNVRNQYGGPYMKSSIAESGTNELEIVEFDVGENKFGMNVNHVKEIINPVNVTAVPHTHPAIKGITQIRGEVVPVVSMATVLGFPEADHRPLQKFIVYEFNGIKIAFHVDAVSQIHRILSEQVETPNEKYFGIETSVNGVVHLNNEFILLLDYENIFADILQT